MCEREREPFSSFSLLFILRSCLSSASSFSLPQSSMPCHAILFHAFNAPSLPLRGRSCRENSKEKEGRNSGCVSSHNTTLFLSLPRSRPKLGRSRRTLNLDIRSCAILSRRERFIHTLPCYTTLSSLSQTCQEKISYGRDKQVQDINERL